MRLLDYTFNLSREMPFIRYIRANFEFGHLDRVRCIGDFVIPGSLHRNSFYTFYCNFGRALLGLRYKLKCSNVISPSFFNCTSRCVKENSYSRQGNIIKL